MDIKDVMSKPGDSLSSRATVKPTSIIPEPPQIIPTSLLKDPNLADGFHHRLINWINDFHRKLDDKHEVGAQLVNFGQIVTFHIEDISYWNPSLISFIGKNESGEAVELVQHVSQISILLVAMKRAKPEEPKRPIGFASWDDFDKQKQD